jgi:hypothetical protein
MSQQQGSYHVHQAKNISYFNFGMFSAAAVYSHFLPMFGLGSSMVVHVSAVFQPWFVMLILYFFWRHSSSNNPDGKKRKP